MAHEEKSIEEDDELIEDAVELLKSGVFKNDLNLRNTITMFQHRFRIGWYRGFSLAIVLSDRGLLVNSIVYEEIADETSKRFNNF